MTSPSVGIASILNDAGIAVSGTNMFVGDLPDTAPDFAIMLLDSGGPAPVPTLTRDYKDIQIIVRSNIEGYPAGWTMAESIKNKLLGLDPTTIGTDIFESFLMRSDITFLGYDANRRPKFSLNFRIVIDGPNVGNRKSIQ